MISANVQSLKSIRNFTFELELDSIEFVLEVAKQFSSFPGKIIEFICLESKEQLDPLAIFERKLRESNQPLKFAANFMSLYNTYRDESKDVLEDVLQIWEENCDLILEESKALSKKTEGSIKKT